jgi:hypothetical protein
MAIRIMAKGSADQIMRYFTLVAERMTSIFDFDREESPTYQRRILVSRPAKVGARDTALNAGIASYCRSASENLPASR